MPLSKARNKKRMRIVRLKCATYVQPKKDKAVQPSVTSGYTGITQGVQPNQAGKIVVIGGTPFRAT